MGKKRKRRKVKPLTVEQRFGRSLQYLVVSAGEFVLRDTCGSQRKAVFGRSMIGQSIPVREAVAEPLVEGGLLLPLEH